MTLVDGLPMKCLAAVHSPDASTVRGRECIIRYTCPLSVPMCVKIYPFTIKAVAIETIIAKKHRGTVVLAVSVGACFMWA